MNLETIHTPPDDIQRVMRWVAKAQVDYTNHYLSLYIAYNAWYCQVTGTVNNRQAIAILKKRFIIWGDYTSKRAMRTLEPLMEQLVDLTQREPLAETGKYWSGEVHHSNDWRSLIEYWYKVRCVLVHGGTVPGPHVLLAYQTLNIFMGEIIRRVEVCLEASQTDELQRLSQKRWQYTSGSKKFQQIQRQLYRKYVAMPDIWQVDMQHVPDTP